MHHLTIDNWIYNNKWDETHEYEPTSVYFAIQWHITARQKYSPRRRQSNGSRRIHNNNERMFIICCVCNFLHVWRHTEVGWDCHSLIFSHTTVMQTHSNHLYWCICIYIMHFAAVYRKDVIFIFIIGKWCLHLVFVDYEFNNKLIVLSLYSYRSIEYLYYICTSMDTCRRPTVFGPHSFLHMLPFREWIYSRVLT